MKTKIKKVLFVSLGMLLFITLFYPQKTKFKAKEGFKFGIESLVSNHKDLLKGKRVGLITNPTGVDQNLKSSVDILFEDKDINLTALYGPEHGVRGNAEAGSKIESYTDPKTGLTVYSLYGKTRKPTEEMLKNVDVLLFDIQDVGVTYYTYIWSLYYVMEAAKEYGKEVIVLDRPNPLGGQLVDGPVIVEDGNSTFVGLKDLAMIHGMTVAEIAKYFNGEFKMGVNLNVVPMENYDPSLKYDELGLFFVMPSPNIPTTDTADTYPMTGFFETFTNVSEGRGTTKPFQLIGAEFIDSTDYAKALNELNLPGVKFRPAAFTPATGQKLAGKLVQGVEVYVTDNKKYDPIRTGLSMIATIEKLYPGKLEYRDDNWLAKLTGKSYIQEDLKSHVEIDSIINKWHNELETFKGVRSKYLIYDRKHEDDNVIKPSYVIEANDFEMKLEEAKNLTYEMLIEKSLANAKDESGKRKDVKVLNHTIQMKEGKYSVRFVVSEDESFFKDVTVTIVKTKDEKPISTDDSNNSNNNSGNSEKPSNSNLNKTKKTLPNTGASYW